MNRRRTLLISDEFEEERTASEVFFIRSGFTQVMEFWKTPPGRK